MASAPPLNLLSLNLRTCGVIAGNCCCCRCNLSRGSWETWTEHVNQLPLSPDGNWDMRRRRLLQLPLEVDDNKRRVLLAAAPGPGAGAHVAVDGVRLCSYLLDSLELSDFEMKCVLRALRLYIKIDLISSHLASSQGFGGGSFRFLFGGACTHWHDACEPREMERQLAPPPPSWSMDYGMAWGNGSSGR